MCACTLDSTNTENVGSYVKEHIVQDNYFTNNTSQGCGSSLKVVQDQDGKTSYVQTYTLCAKKNVNDYDPDPTKHLLDPVEKKYRPLY